MHVIHIYANVPFSKRTFGQRIQERKQVEINNNIHILRCLSLENTNYYHPKWVQYYKSS